MPSSERLVPDQPPEPVIGAWSDSVVGFSGGTVTSYTWSWGDGTARTVTATARASHTYAAPGSYTITLKVKDNYGATGTATYKLIAS
jgi:PKD domain